MGKQENERRKQGEERDGSHLAAGNDGTITEKTRGEGKMRPLTPAQLKVHLFELLRLRLKKRFVQFITG